VGDQQETMLGKSYDQGPPMSRFNFKRCPTSEKTNGSKAGANDTGQIAVNEHGEPGMGEFPREYCSRYQRRKRNKQGTDTVDLGKGGECPGVRTPKVLVS